jgi:TrpR-related protein YerC/YecD
MSGKRGYTDSTLQAVGFDARDKERNDGYAEPIFPELDELYDAILSFKTREECCAFFSILPPFPSSVRCLSGFRWQSRSTFYDYTYDVISNGCGVSAATISRVKNSLLYARADTK